MQKIVMILVAVSCFLAVSSLPADPCTVFRLKAGDGSIILGRSFEYALEVKNDAIVVPRNRTYSSPSPDGKEGLTWKTRYGYVGIAALGMDYGVSDGMNEKGLAVGMLWYETDMKWQDVAPDERSRSLAQAMVGDWILGNFASVEDVRREIRKVKVFKYTDPESKISPTVHFIVYDASGGCIVIEYENGMCNIYDNPLGIMTNAPGFQWHLTNLRQYPGLTTENPEPYQMYGRTFLPTGHGAGMFGLPGDLTPPSRFVRLAVLTRFSDKQPDAGRSLNLAQHIMNTFDIPLGLVTDATLDKTTVLKESTQWASFRDITNRIYYFRTYDNQNLRKIDLNALDFSGSAVKRIQMFGAPEAIVDITKQAQ